MLQHSESTLNVIEQGHQTDSIKGRVGAGVVISIMNQIM